MTRLKVGQRVKVLRAGTGYSGAPVGRTGVFRGCLNHSYGDCIYTVEFVAASKGLHSCQGKVPSGRGYCFPRDALEVTTDAPVTLEDHIYEYLDKQLNPP